MLYVDIVQEKNTVNDVSCLKIIANYYNIKKANLTSQPTNEKSTNSVRRSNLVGGKKRILLQIHPVFSNVRLFNLSLNGS